MIANCYRGYIRIPAPMVSAVILDVVDLGVVVPGVVVPDAVEMSADCSWLSTCVLVVVPGVVVPDAVRQQRAARRQTAAK